MGELCAHLCPNKQCLACMCDQLQHKHNLTAPDCRGGCRCSSSDTLVQRNQRLARAVKELG